MNDNDNQRYRINNKNDAGGTKLIHNKHIIESKTKTRNTNTMLLNAMFNRFTKA